MSVKCVKISFWGGRPGPGQNHQSGSVLCSVGQRAYWCSLLQIDLFYSQFLIPDVCKSMKPSVQKYRLIEMCIHTKYTHWKHLPVGITVRTGDCYLYLRILIQYQICHQPSSIIDQVTSPTWILWKSFFKWLISNLSLTLLSTALCIIIRASVVLRSSFTFIMS